jgi:hypothetical protein
MYLIYLCILSEPFVLKMENLWSRDVQFSGILWQKKDEYRNWYLAIGKLSM